MIVIQKAARDVSKQGEGSAADIDLSRREIPIIGGITAFLNIQVRLLAVPFNALSVVASFADCGVRVSAGLVGTRD